MPEQLGPSPTVLQVNPADLRQVAGVFTQLRSRIDDDIRRIDTDLMDAAAQAGDRRLADSLQMADWDVVTYARTKVSQRLATQTTALLAAADRFLAMDQASAAKLAAVLHPPGQGHGGGT